MQRDQLERSLFLTLDGMRGVGAILVAIGHNVLFWGIASGIPPIPFCVDLFFILSGYVIAFAYEPRFAQGMTAATFMRQRLVRLYPLYLLGILMGAAVLGMAALGNAKELSAVGLALVPQLLMLPSPDFNGTGDIYPLNMPSWTLLFELWANLIFVLVWRWLSTRMVALIVAGSAALLAIVSVSYGHLDMGPNWANFWGGFARAMFGFFTGVLVYRLTGAKAETPHKRSWWALPAIAAVPVLCLIPDIAGIPRIAVELVIVCMIGPVLLYWGQAIQPPVLFTRLFAWLGAISYAMYVLHYPIFEFTKRLSAQFPQLYQEWTPWTGAVSLLVSVIVSTLAVQMFDTPVRRWLNARLKALGGRRRVVAAE